METKKYSLLSITTTTTTTTSDSKTKPPIKRFIRNQIPESILTNASLNAAISNLLPPNYNFEVHKTIWRILSSGAKRVALQLPEGLLLYSLVLSDIFKSFASLDDCFVLADVTYGACCIDDLSAAALSADLLIHYGHSCLIPIDSVRIPSLYVFVDIQIDLDHLIATITENFNPVVTKKLALAGTIQFSSAIHAAKIELLKLGFDVAVPQSRPLSAGEVLGCTAPTIPAAEGIEDVVFVADGRFHLEAIMIANPRIRAFRYDPYLRALFLENYDHDGMKEARKKAILTAREAKSWGVILGTLGRQGNPRILDRLQKRMAETGLSWTVFLMSEISPARISLFGDSVDAWIQIACPRLSIDWGEAFEKPLLNPFEAEIALGFLRGWWDKSSSLGVGGIKRKDDLKCEKGSCCNCDCSIEGTNNAATDYPMDYYAKDGGEWNCSYSSKSSSLKPSPLHRKPRCSTDGHSLLTLATSKYSSQHEHDVAQHEHDVASASVTYFISTLPQG